MYPVVVSKDRSVMMVYDGPWLRLSIKATSQHLGETILTAAKASILTLAAVGTGQVKRASLLPDLCFGHPSDRH
jgi:hypothetical protein